MPNNKKPVRVRIQWYDKATESLKEKECLLLFFLPGHGLKEGVFIFQDGNTPFTVDDIQYMEFLDDNWAFGRYQS